MSSSLSGGTNALNFNVVKSSSSTLTSLTSSSPSSTLTISEASNVSQSAIRTKRPRTNRKRPNQTFNEAAALLSKAYPNLFPNLEKLPPPCKFTKPITEFNNNDSFEPLLLPFDLRARDYDATAFLLRENKSTSQTSVREKIFSGERSLSSGAVNLDEVERDSGEDFDCQSILEEEIDEGIDSIIGSRVEDAGNSGGNEGGRVDLSCGGGFRSFGGKFSWKKALRHVDGVNLLNFAMIDVLEISPGMKKMPAATATIVPVTEKKKQRKKENLKRNTSSFALPLRLKLNYADVRNSWSERGLPFRR